MVTERRLSGRREGVLGGESRLKALAIMRVAAETYTHAQKICTDLQVWTIMLVSEFSLYTFITTGPIEWAKTKK